MADSRQMLPADPQSGYSRHNWLTPGLAVLIVLLAYVLRVHALDTQSIWFDEGWSWYLAKLPLTQMANVTAGDRSPVLYYTLLHAWIVFAGESEFAMRLLSTCADITIVAVLFAFSRVLSRGKGAMPWLAGLLYAISPLSVWYAQEVRMYALVAALCVASCYWLWRWLVRPVKTRFLVISAGLMALAVHTHYYAVFLLPAQGLGTFLVLMTLHQTRRNFWKWLVAAGIVLGLLAPWLLYASIGFAYDDGFVFPLNTVSGRIGEWIMAFADGGLPRLAPGWWPWALTAAIIAGIISFTLNRSRRQLLFTVVLIVGSLFAATIAVRLAYPYRSVFHPRYLIFISPLACILCAGLANSAERLKSRFSIGLALSTRVLALLALASIWLPALQVMYTDPSVARDDVRDAVRHVVEALAPGDLVVLTRDNYAVQYYLQRNYPRQSPAFMAAPEGLHGILKSDVDLIQNLQQRNPQRVRLFLWQDDVVDPQNLVETTLWANGYEIGENNFGQIRLPLYQIQQRPMQPMVFAPAQVNINDQLELTGYWMRHDGLAGDWFYTVLTWHSRVKTKVDYKVFVHVLDKNGRSVFQKDKLSLNSLLPMSSWTVGDNQRDAYAMVIPKSLPAGAYQVVVGVYDPAFPVTPLPVQSSTLAVSDNAIMLGTLQVHTQ
jgi:mannosyltransferase